MPQTENAPVPAARKWITAVRPFAYPASCTPVLLGLAIAYHAGHAARWGRFAVTLAGVFCFHTAANLLNDVFDYRRGLDRDVRPTSGAVVRGWLTERQVLRAALGLLTVGVLCGLWLAYVTGWPILLLGVAGAVIALGYTGPGFCLKYAGLGDAAIFLTFGVLPVLGTFWVQAGSFSWLPVLWSVPLGALTVGILHANNRRDLATDPTMGCRTLASRLGEQGSARYYRLLLLGPFVFVLALLLCNLVPGGDLLNDGAIGGDNDIPASLVDEDGDYIERNPVRARMVEAARDYPTSGL